MHLHPWPTFMCFPKGCMKDNGHASLFKPLVFNKMYRTPSNMVSNYRAVIRVLAGRCGCLLFLGFGCRSHRCILLTHFADGHSFILKTHNPSISHDKVISSEQSIRRDTFFFLNSLSLTLRYFITRFSLAQRATVQSWLWLRSRGDGQWMAAACKQREGGSGGRQCDKAVGESQRATPPHQECHSQSTRCQKHDLLSLGSAVLERKDPVLKRERQAEGCTQLH